MMRVPDGGSCSTRGETGVSISPWKRSVRVFVFSVLLSIANGSTKCFSETRISKHEFRNKSKFLNWKMTKTRKLVSNFCCLSIWCLFRNSDFGFRALDEHERSTLNHLYLCL